MHSGAPQLSVTVNAVPKKNKKTLKGQTTIVRSVLVEERRVTDKKS